MTYKITYVSGEIKTIEAKNIKEMCDKLDLYKKENIGTKVEKITK